MDYQQLIAWAKARLSEAKDEIAAEIVAYIDAHPSQSLQTLCKEIDPDDWNALRHRAQALQKARSEGVPARPAPGWKEREKRKILNDPARREDLEDEIAKDPATVARINQKAEELRPTPKPVQRAHPLVAVAELGAAEAKYRKALTGIEEVVRDGRIHPSELEESINEVDRWKVRLSILQGWTGNMDEQLENLMNGGSNE